MARRSARRSRGLAALLASLLLGAEPLTAEPDPAVSQLADVRSGEWAERTLTSLERQLGLPDPARPHAQLISRAEFAVRLGRVLAAVEKSAQQANALDAEQFDALRRLQLEFLPEREGLTARLENLEKRLDRARYAPFDSKTTMSGQVIFGLSTLSNTLDDDEGDSTAVRFSGRARLTFDTTFGRNDRLRVRLQAGDFPNYGSLAGTDMARLGVGGNTNRVFNVARLEYRFDLAKNLRVYIGALGGRLDDFTDALHPLVGSTGSGAISRFGQRNAIYRLISGTGVGVRWEATKTLTLSAGFVADFGSLAEDDDLDDVRQTDRFLPTGILAQLNFQPSKTTGIGLSYIRTFNATDTGTGSDLANDPFDGDSKRTFADSYGLQGFWKISPGFQIGGWFGLTEARAEDLPGRPGSSIVNYALSFAFADLAGKGNLGGLVIGQPPRVTRSDLGNKFQDPDGAVHLEIFYRIRLTDRISITPGLLTIFNPENNRNNPTVQVGTLRATFDF
ncbi:iron uptake porin [Gloeobacter violaceus]|uniref:Glr1069 protein n=1 Tax=Gloeobacter violaceus (strain ATCC 29082 / PCC 7421) TaxID=251221 RepID=Q7NLQ2_GLOVI|nr:iron uptake porin [Gloeobacter violaceus]BAC89010.1 glr1069 [Gloeobacter violaceus PCC 7421]